MPIQTTLGNILLYNRVYVIKKIIDGVEKVIYVGKAENQSVGGRMDKHFKSPNASPFCRRLASCGDCYKNWTVDVYTLSECEALLGGQLESVRLAEKAMIAHFNPLDNVQR